MSKGLDRKGEKTDPGQLQLPGPVPKRVHRAQLGPLSSTEEAPQPEMSWCFFKTCFLLCYCTDWQEAV